MYSVILVSGVASLGELIERRTKKSPFEVKDVGSASLSKGGKMLNVLLFGLQ